jgi:hypothetical protein
VDKRISCPVISILIGAMDKLFPNDGWFLVFYHVLPTAPTACAAPPGAASSIEAASIHGWHHPAPEMRHIAIAIGLPQCLWENPPFSIGKLNGSNRNPIGIQDAKIKAFFGWQRSCDHVMSASFEFVLAFLRDVLQARTSDCLAF